MTFAMHQQHHHSSRQKSYFEVCNLTENASSDKNHIVKFETLQVDYKNNKQQQAATSNNKQQQTQQQKQQQQHKLQLQARKNIVDIIKPHQGKNHIFMKEKCFLCQNHIVKLQEIIF